MRINGTEIADTIYHELQDRVGELQKKNIAPHLVVILVGENPASMAYVTLKQRKGEAIGAVVTILRYEETVTTEELVEKVKQLNQDTSVHGILIQRPLPSHIDVAKLEETTNPDKDVDGFHPDSPYTLPLPLAVVKILEEIYDQEKQRGVTRLEGSEHAQAPEVMSMIGGKPGQDPELNEWLSKKHIVILGKGPTGGGPILVYFKKLHLNPTIIDSKTQDAQTLIKNADIIIAATGRENMITPEMLKQEVILIGVSVLKGADGKLHGDYEPDAIENIASFYTPTPGGVGPVNVAKLMENLITATEKQTK